METEERLGFTDVHVFRGALIQWVPTLEVRVGDRVACWLSDATEYVMVDGWTDRVSDLTRYDLGVTHYRTFTGGRSWWADDHTTFDQALTVPVRIVGPVPPWSE